MKTETADRLVRVAAEWERLATLTRRVAAGGDPGTLPHVAEASLVAEAYRGALYAVDRDAKEERAAGKAERRVA